MPTQANPAGLKVLYALVGLVAVALVAAVVLMDRRLSAVTATLERLGAPAAQPPPGGWGQAWQGASAQSAPFRGTPATRFAQPGTTAAERPREPQAEQPQVGPGPGQTPHARAFIAEHQLTPDQWQALALANKEWVETIKLARKSGTSALPAPLGEMQESHERRLAEILGNSDLTKSYHELEQRSAINIATFKAGGQTYTAIDID